MTQVSWLNIEPGLGERGAWDMNIIEELTAGEGFVHIESNELIDSRQGAVVVIAGQHMVGWAPLVAALAEALPWSLVIVTSDEEALFPVDLLPRDDKCAVWTQYHDRGMDRVIPIGPQPDTWQHVGLCGLGHVRENAVWFAGQDTHERRHELLATMKDMAADSIYGHVGWAATTGFRQGLSQDRYITALCHARLAPCPSGPHSLDSFRLYEALAAGALPIVERCTPHGEEPGFWRALFGEDCPLNVVTSWRSLPALAEWYSDPIVWTRERDKVQEWWRIWREDFRREFYDTIERLRS